jgi:initiation factor 1A
MSHNTFGGNSYKKTKKIREQKSVPINENDYYGIVLKIIGGNRISVKLDDDRIDVAIIPGRFRKKLWLNPQDKIRLNSGEVVAKIFATDKDAQEANNRLSSKNDIFYEDEIDNSDDDEDDDEDFLELATQNQIKPVNVSQEKNISPSNKPPDKPPIDPNKKKIIDKKERNKKIKSVKGKTQEFTNFESI